jgi:hypothetical protein
VRRLEEEAAAAAIHQSDESSISAAHGPRQRRQVVEALLSGRIQ